MCSGRLGNSCFNSGTRRFNLIYKPGVKPISPSFVINQMNPKFNTHLCRGPWSWCPNISSSVESVDGRRCLVSYPMSKEAFCDVCLDRYPLDCVEDCLEYCFDICLARFRFMMNWSKWSESILDACLINSLECALDNCLVRFPFRGLCSSEWSELSDSVLLWCAISDNCLQGRI